MNGEKVLVPVLYLANAGTLRASNNLSAAAGNDLINSGRIEAGNRLDLLAGNNLVNQSGGVIAGRDVTLTAVKGDVINERSRTGLGMGEDNRSYFGDAARVEAANDLTIKAGRDFTNSGSVLKSGADTLINVGRDINIVATQTLDSGDGGMWKHTSNTTQSGSTVSAGRDVQMNAGRDLNAIASVIDAKRDIGLSAREDMNLASAADEDHSLAKSKKKTTQEDHVSQVGTVVSAGADIRLSAGNGALKFRGSEILGGSDPRESIVASHGKLKFFCALRLSELSIGTVVDVIIDERCSYIVATPKSFDIEPILDVGWSGSLAEDFSLCGRICEEKGLLFKPVGEFDDHEWGFVSIGSPEILKKLLS
nr:hemagglutinin repeat-containing protein [Pseudomonas trivialis]